MQHPDFYSTPTNADINQKKLDILRIRARKEIDEGLLPSAQIAIAKDGKVVWTETFGDGNDDSLYAVFSCTKAIVSSAAWLVIQDGLLDIEEVVADIVPEFGTNEKESIKVKQLLLHTAGFPHAPFAPLGLG